MKHNNFNVICFIVINIITYHHLHPDGIWELNEEECIEVSECIDDATVNLVKTFCKPSTN